MADVNLDQKMKEIKREARRKRILENADKRLKLITGDHNEPVYTKPISDLIQDEIVKSEVVCETLELPSNTIPAQENEEPPLMLNVNTQQLETSTTIFDNFNSVIVIVAIITRLFLSNTLLRYLISESILMPFILLEIISIVFNKDRFKNKASFFTMVVYLLNLSSNHVNYINCCIKLIENVSKDLAIYFFTFLIFHVFISYVFV